jgi:hypothetical protein
MEPIAYRYYVINGIYLDWFTHLEAGVPQCLSAVWKAREPVGCSAQESGSVRTKGTTDAAPVCG